MRIGRLEQARDRVAGARGAVERGAVLSELGWPVIVSALVTVSSSLRPSYSTICRRKYGSRRPPKRLLARRTPLAIAAMRPRWGV